MLYVEPFGPLTTYVYPAVESDASVYGIVKAALVVPTEEATVEPALIGDNPSTTKLVFCVTGR